MNEWIILLVLITSIMWLFISPLIVLSYLHILSERLSIIEELLKYDNNDPDDNDPDDGEKKVIDFKRAA